MKFSYLIGVAVVAVLGIGAVMLATNVVQRDGTVRGEEATSQPSQTASPSVQESLPEAADVGDKEAIQRRVDRFVSIYYGRSTDLYTGSLQEARDRLAARLKPYVTEAFLVGYLPPLDTPPDLWNKRTGAEIVARVDASSVVGHFEDSETAEETLRVVITPVVDGIKQRKRTLDIALSLVREDGEWRVDQLEELYL